MKRRTYLAAAASAGAVGTAGCFWDDGDGGADPRLATVIISNYADRRQRLVVHVEEAGRDVQIEEFELGPGTNTDPTFHTLGCSWRNDPDELTIDVLLLTGRSISRTVSVPGEVYESYDVGDCVGLNIGIEMPGHGRIWTSFHDCAEYVDDFELCVDAEGSS